MVRAPGEGKAPRRKGAQGTAGRMRSWKISFRNRNTLTIEIRRKICVVIGRQFFAVQGILSGQTVVGVMVLGGTREADAREEEQT